MEVDRSKRLYVILNRYTSVRWCVATYQRTDVPTYIRINVIVSVSIARQTIVRSDRYNYLFPYVTMYTQANDCTYVHTINYTAQCTNLSLFVTLQKKKKWKKRILFTLLFPPKRVE